MANQLIPIQQVSLGLLRAIMSHTQKRKDEGADFPTIAREVNEQLQRLIIATSSRSMMEQDNA